MVLNLAPRGAGAFRPLHLTKVLSHPRVAFIHNHARSISPATNGLLLNLFTKGISPVGVRASSLINSYATAAGHGRSKPGAQKKTTKSAETGKKTVVKKNAAKNTTTKSKSKPKPKPKPKRKVLTEKQKEAKKAKEFREKVKELKAIALEPPKRLPEQPWTVTFQGVYPEAAKNNEKGVASFKAAVELAKSISPEEKEVRWSQIYDSRLRTPADSVNRDILLPPMPTKLPILPHTTNGSRVTLLYKSRKRTTPAGD